MNREQIIDKFLSEKTNASAGNITIHYSTLGDVMLLRNYGTLIAKRKGRNVYVSSETYSKTTTIIQNAIERQAKEKGMRVDRISEDKFKKGGWIAEVDKEMKEKGTVGAFTKQAKEAGMSVHTFAKKVIDNPKDFTEKNQEKSPTRINF